MFGSSIFRGCFLTNSVTMSFVLMNVLRCMNISAKDVNLVCPIVDLRKVFFLRSTSRVSAFRGKIGGKGSKFPNYSKNTRERGCYFQFWCSAFRVWNEGAWSHMVTLFQRNPPPHPPPPPPGNYMITTVHSEIISDSFPSNMLKSLII